LSNKEEPSTTYVREYYAKKRSHTTEHDSFSQATSAYRVLKTASRRNQYQQVIVENQFLPCVNAWEEAYHVISVNPPEPKVSILSSISQFFTRITCSIKSVESQNIPMNAEKVEPIHSGVIFRPY
jgi:hypothetical protein